MFGTIISAMPTPFLEDGSIDYVTIKDFIEYLIENKSDAIVVGGSTGEGSSLSLEEKIELFKECVKITNKRIKANQKTYAFKKGKLDISNFGLINTIITKKFDVNSFTHIIDMSKLPKDAVWRFRKDGDIFEKFGGGTKSLSDYLIDKKRFLSFLDCNNRDV